MIFINNMNDNLVILRWCIGQIVKNLIVLEIIGSIVYSRL